MTTEANLWEWLRDVVLPIGQFSRIETGDTCPGFPDVHYQLSAGASGCLELKCAQDPSDKIPFKKNTRTKDKGGMRRAQIRWILDNTLWGGTVYIIAEVSPRVYVIPGERVAHINGSTRGQLQSLSRAVLTRGKNKQAALILDQILTNPRGE